MQWGKNELHPSLMRIEQRRVRFAVFLRSLQKLRHFQVVVHLDCRLNSSPKKSVTIR